MTDSTERCLKLYDKGYTIKQVADTIGRSSSYVHRRIVKHSNRQRNYYNELVWQAAYSLKRGEVCYCFTESQLNDIRRRFPHFTAEPNEVDYTLIPPARGFYAMKDWLANRART
jgi:IS30 family transposase